MRKGSGNPPNETTTTRKKREAKPRGHIKVAHEKTGRKPMITSEQLKNIDTLMKAGNYFDTSCAFCGIIRQTGQNWLLRGARLVFQYVREGRDDEVPQTIFDDSDSDDRKYMSFFVIVDRARAVAEVSDLSDIGKAGKGDPNKRILPDWRASAWRLERRSPKRFGGSQNIVVDELEDQSDELDTIDIEEMDSEQLRKLIARELGRS